MATTDALARETDVVQILRQWEEDHQSSSYDPIPTLKRLAEIIESETENYLKMDPDPFDERHPSRTDPECNFGHILKVLFRKDNFMTRLINDYLRDSYYTRAGISGRDVRQLNIAACRLMLDILPGLETSAVFQPDNDGLIHRLFSWAEKSPEPLRSYATGLLAAAMEVQDIATGFREQNAKMVPLMLQRLHKLQEDHPTVNNRPFASFGHNRHSFGDSENKCVPGKRKIRDKLENGVKNSNNLSFLNEEGPNSPDNEVQPTKKRRSSPDDEEPQNTTPMKSSDYQQIMSPPQSVPNTPNSIKDQGTPSNTPNRGTPPRSLNIARSSATRNLTHSVSTPSMLLEGNSNSSWAEMESYVIGNIQMYPPTLATQQMLIFRYLTPMGEYQEFLQHVFEKNALDLILKYINVRETKDSRLAFEALKYLASLLCHKKFSIEFLNANGLDKLLDVPRPSVAATGVSICLYYLAYCEDALERVCQKPKAIISNLVTYALWLLERSHDSGRCHATMFFGCSFPFKIILEEFDAQDGLRKLFNVISTLPILNVDDESILNDDEECASRQIVRHVAVALKKYIEAHLYLKAEQLQQQQRVENELGQQVVPQSLSSKPCKFKNEEEAQEKVELLLKLMNVRTHWPPVEKLYELGSITLLLQIIALAREWNFSNRAYNSSCSETVRSCLDVIAVCTVVPKVMLLLCDRVDMPDSSMTMAINLLLAAAEGEITPDADVQRAALRAIVNCVCAPIQRVSGTVVRFSSTGSNKKKTNTYNSEELIQKVWSSVRSNNGIMVLLQLMMVKTPITDADSIRALACRALAGLARSEKVRQIIGKLSMFTGGQLQSLMTNPIHNEKRQEHVMFQKYALELIERVSGKAKPTNAEYELSLASLHRANVIAQTKIQYDKQQLNQLIYQHFMSEGLYHVAAELQRSVGLDSAVMKPMISYQPFTYSTPAPAVAARPGYSPGYIYNTNPRNQRDGFNRSNALAQTPPSTRYISHTSSTPITPGVRIKLADSLNQSGSNNQPIKLQINQKKHQQDKVNSMNQSLSTPFNRSLQKQISRDPGAVAGAELPLTSHTAPLITLDSIVTEYLTNQHALCKNPMVTCPKFNLFEPHKCPDPRPKSSAAVNITVRSTRRQVGINDKRLDRRYIYSRFCPIKTFRPTDVEGAFMCCTFSADQQSLMVGTYSGDVKMFNIHTGIEEASYQCHESYLSHMECNKRGDLLLTSTAWRRPLSGLWSIGTFFDLKLTMEAEDYVEFSKHQDKIIGTQSDTATIYDVVTGKLISTLTPSIASNGYFRNRATFSVNDELVLSDGILWDVNSGKEIHKFDKLNASINGFFHPSGTEIISHTEVWDLRTFHLLNTVPALENHEVVFSPVNHILYGVFVDQDNDNEPTCSTAFQTLDALDYSSIATCDVKKGIYSLACNKYDTQIAIVENVGEEYINVQESSVRLYDVGRRRDDEDEADEDDDEDDLDASDDDDGSNSDSDDDDDDNNGDDPDNADQAGDADQNLNEGEDNDDHDDDDDDDDDDDENDDDDDDDDDDDTLDGDDSANDSDEFNPESPDYDLSDMDDFEALFHA